MRVSPSARTAAMMAFSVAVTDASSRNILRPTRERTLMPIWDVRLGGVVLDEGVAVREDRGHDGVLGRGHGRFVEEHLAADEGAHAHADLGRAARRRRVR